MPTKVEIELSTHKGSKAKLLRAMASIKAMCSVDEVTDCLIWQGRVSGAAETPTAFVGGRNVSLVRFVYEHATCKPVPASSIVWRTCCNHRCLNKLHMREGTRAEHGQWVRETGSQRGSLKRLKSSRASAAARTIVTPAIVREILLSDKPHAEWAAELSVQPQAIRRALMRRTDAAPNSSVFAWRPAA